MFISVKYFILLNGLKIVSLLMKTVNRPVLLSKRINGILYF